MYIMNHDVIHNVERERSESEQIINLLMEKIYTAKDEMRACCNLVLVICVVLFMHYAGLSSLCKSSFIRTIAVSVSLICQNSFDINTPAETTITMISSSLNDTCGNRCLYFSSIASRNSTTSL